MHFGTFFVICLFPGANMETMLPCTREHAFQGFAGSDFAPSPAPSSGPVLGTLFCTPVQIFCDKIDKIGVLGVPEVTPNIV